MESNRASCLTASHFTSQLRPEHKQPEEPSSRCLSTSPYFTSLSSANGIEDPSSAAASEYAYTHESSSLENSRPTPTQMRTTDMQNLLIPPRRELPFPKPREKSSGSDLPPLLPKPTPVANAYSPSKVSVVSSELGSPPTPIPRPRQRVAQRKAPTPRQVILEDPEKAAAVKVPGEAVKSDTSPAEDEPSPLAAKSAAVTSRPASAPLGLLSKASASVKKRPAPSRPLSVNKRPKMISQGTQTQTVAAQNCRIEVAHIESTKNHVPDAMAESASPAIPPNSYLDGLDEIITSLKTRPPAKELWEQPGYSSAGPEHREKLLNDFICENLDNPEFLMLCQDAQTAWRRIGLGM